MASTMNMILPAGSKAFIEINEKGFKDRLQ
jgi:hypothetical protein